MPTIGWTMFGLYPSVATFFYSFTQYSGVPGTPLNVCGLCNYAAATSSLLSNVAGAIWTTVKFAVGVTVVQTALSLGLALIFQRRGRSFTFYRAIIFLPGILSVPIVGGMFSLLLDPVSGPVGELFRNAFGIESAFLGSGRISLFLIMGITIWMGCGYGMIIFIAGLRAIPRESYEAASVDGAGRFRTFRHITWPLLAPATTVCVFLTSMAALGEFALVLVLTEGNFGTKTLGVYMFTSAFGTSSQLGYGSMIAIVQFFLTLLIGGGLLLALRRREVTL
ncbi:carbohydrate ABC transporter permease [Actinopolymorpha alba]|uniref:carbohydrate ABC transporter permease n=1 Tax=Actinopolymorpha alba TaxID=533267 RepID=UPI0003A4E4CA|nr:sugar ABC transporter permease [Actinopolymorpha alba]